MSKLVCECGHVITNVKYPSAGESSVLEESALDQMLSRVGDVLGELGTVDTGNRAEWLKQRFGNEYPPDASNSEILEDALSQELTSKARSLVECPSCGRLHLQMAPGSNDYASFLPEGKQAKL